MGVYHLNGCPLFRGKITNTSNCKSTSTLQQNYDTMSWILCLADLSATMIPQEGFFRLSPRITASALLSTIVATIYYDITMRALEINRNSSFYRRLLQLWQYHDLSLKRTYTITLVAKSRHLHDVDPWSGTPTVTGSAVPQALPRAGIHWLLCNRVTPDRPAVKVEDSETHAADLRQRHRVA